MNNKIIKGSTLQRNIIGVDIGQAQDHTAITVLEQRQQAIGDNKYINVYLVRFLERVPLKTPYPQVITKVMQIFTKLYTDGKPLVLVLDITGVGRPIFDSFKQAQLKPAGVQIHGGTTVTQDGSIWNVPKRDLAGVLQVLYQTGRILVSSQLQDAQTLNNELLNFKIKININSGHDSYEAWRESIHDDLVLAVACAAWYGEKAVCNPNRYMHFVVSKRRSRW